MTLGAPAAPKVKVDEPPSEPEQEPVSDPESSRSDWAQAVRARAATASTATGVALRLNVIDTSLGCANLESHG